MAWRLPQILIAMAAVLILGLCSVWFMEARMGGATVPGLVLIEAPFADLDALNEALEAARSAAATHSAAAPGDVQLSRAHTGACAGPGVPFAPFAGAVLERLRGRGDTMVLYVPVGDGEAADPGTASPVWQSVLASQRPEDEGPADRAQALLSTRQQLTGFCIGLVLEAQGGQLATEVVPPLLDAMADLPEFRRSSLVVLGATIPGDPPRRAYLRIDRGPWKGQSTTDLSDLLEATW